jgi:hypothetical protein
MIEIDGDREAMLTGETGNSNFINLWRKCKIEKLREIEHLCSAIMDVLQIADDSSEGIPLDELSDGEMGNRKFAYKLHLPVDRIDWAKRFGRLRIGKRIAGYGNEHEGDTFKTLFRQDDSGWRQAFYREDLGSFPAIRNECKMMSQLLQSDMTGYGENGFKAIDGTVTFLVECTFALIGIHEQEHKISEKLQEYEMREQERKKADEVIQEGRVKGGRAPKKNAAILEAVKQFIIEKRRRIEQKAATIANSFMREYDSSDPFEITVDSTKYDVYCDGKRIRSRSSTGEKGKYHDKSIKYSTLLGKYIPDAKNAVSSSPSKKQ